MLKQRKYRDIDTYKEWKWDRVIEKIENRYYGEIFRSLGVEIHINAKLKSKSWGHV